MSTNEKKLGVFTYILNQAKNGEVKVLTRAPDGFKGVDQGRLKAKYPAIFQNLVAIGVKLTIKPKVNEETGEAFISQHPNEAVQYQCCTGLSDVKHSMKPKSQMNQPGPAALVTLDLSKDAQGNVINRCTNLVYAAKGDEHLHAPICETCRGGEEKSNRKLPTDVLAALGLDIDEV